MKYIAGFIIAISLLIFAFVLIFRGGDDTTTAPNTPPKLVSYADTSTEVRLTIDYPVSAPQTHRQIITTVGRDQTKLVVEQGYDGQTLRSQTYDNTETAYAHFLSALQVAGFSKGENSEQLKEWRGQCPEGRRYLYEIIDGGKTIQQYWATSCGNIGSFKGRTTTVNSLFIKQVPDYHKLTSGIGVGL